MAEVALNPISIGRSGDRRIDLTRGSAALIMVLFLNALACSPMGCVATTKDIAVPAGGDIQVAIDTVAAREGGGVVTLKAGTHVINRPIKMNSNVTLQGEGTLASTLITTNDIKMITASADGLDNLTIRNMVIVGTNSVHGWGIHLASYNNNHHNVTLSGVHVFETGWGVHIKGAENLLIEHCNFSRNGNADNKGYAHNLYLRRCYSATITTSSFTNSVSGNGINISYCKDISILGCQVIGNHFRGIRAADSDGFFVHDCVIGENGTVGLLANTEKVVTDRKSTRLNSSHYS